MQKLAVGHAPSLSTGDFFKMWLSVGGKVIEIQYFFFW